jgi:hypothetical protein
VSASALAQFNAGKQRHLEETYPAVITLAGVLDPEGTGGALRQIPCAGGNLRNTGAKAMMGGILGEYALAFRVRRELAPVMPVVGSLLGFEGRQWRIDRVAAPGTEGVWVIGANQASK